ncbi:MAG TPA: serine O-acetyltransferase EpsC [Ktedonobacterales bacterium]|nr:serine O-acetyltransferase EpsC [Ktedonobacterales bacterium]
MPQNITERVLGSADAANAGPVLVPDSTQDGALQPAPALVDRTPHRKRTRWPDDIDVIFEKDPAARNIFEVLLYQGLHAVVLHRIAHKLYQQGIPFVPRLLSQVARVITAGIEIHPGAKIGRRFFIDHGTGVVIGETAEIGDNVMLYHQVTLGATGWWKHRGDGRVKRHPTIEDNVTIGVGASILGPITIGHGSKIGAMSLVLESLPPHSVVLAQPGKLQIRPGTAKDLEPQWDTDQLPDYTI